MLWTLLILIGIVLVVSAVLALRPRFLTRGPRGEVGYTLLWNLVRAFTRVVHRVRYIGGEHLPQAGPLIVVSNHTGGVDPLLISAAVPFDVRWMMARDTMSPDFRWFWEYLDLLPVARDGRDLAAAREAIRHLRSGGVIGIFPEGGIENPPGEIRPFMEGVGVIIAKSEAPVLLTWVSGTTFTPSAFGSVLRPSRARVEFLGIFDFPDERSPQAITRTLREAIAERSGWPLNDEPLPSARRAATVAAPAAARG